MCNGSVGLGYYKYEFQYNYNTALILFNYRTVCAVPRSYLITPGNLNKNTDTLGRPVISEGYISDTFCVD